MNIRNTFLTSSVPLSPLGLGQASLIINRVSLLPDSQARAGVWGKRYMIIEGWGTHGKGKGPDNRYIRMDHRYFWKEKKKKFTLFPQKKIKI